MIEMGSKEQKRIKHAQWTFLFFLVVIGYFTIDFVLDPDSKGKDVGPIMMLALPAVVAFFRYRKIKRQRGLEMIGDDSVLKDL